AGHARTGPAWSRPRSDPTGPALRADRPRRSTQILPRGAAASGTVAVVGDAGLPPEGPAPPRAHHARVVLPTFRQPAGQDRDSPGAGQWSAEGSPWLGDERWPSTKTSSTTGLAGSPATRDCGARRGSTAGSAAGSAAGSTAGNAAGSAAGDRRPPGRQLAVGQRGPAAGRFLARPDAAHRDIEAT